MLDPGAESISNPIAMLAPLLPPLLGVLTASLAGSVHCVGMCGGLMFAATGLKHSHQILYHLGRGLTYTLAGALAGGVGQGLFGATWVSAWAEPLQLLFSTLLGIALLILAVQILVYGKMPHSSFGAWVEAPLRWVSRGQSSMWRSSLIGALTVFLPCGWLMSFLLMALATHQATVGALMMFVFWLGTVPLLAATRILTQGILARLFRERLFREKKGAYRWVAMGMILMGFGSFLTHWWGHLRPGVRATADVINCHQR